MSRYLLVFGGGVILLVGMLFLNITQGDAGLGIQTVIEAIVAPQDVTEHHIIRTLRLSRATMGMIAGSSLAAAGVLLQTITRNPLSSAQTLGINSGAFLAITVVVVFFPSLSSYSLVIAFIGGFAAIALVYAMAGGITASPLRLTLAGIAVAMAIGAVTGTLQLMYEEDAGKLLAWGSGSLEQNNWDGVRFASPWIFPAALIALGLSKSLDLFELGDEMAQSLGQRVRFVRVTALLLAVLLAAATVSVVGGIGFIGLIAPHLMRMMGIKRHLPLLISSMIWGAVVLLGADTLARMVAVGVEEMPVGAVTAIIGGPWMIWLAIRARRGGGRFQSSSDSSSLAALSSRRIPYPVLLAILSVLAVVILLAGISLGSLRLQIADILAAMATGGGEDMTRNIIFNMRLPRMAVAAVSGAALAASGLLLQGVVKNPLADPSIIGVSSGAGVGALILLIALPQINISWLPLAAFAGAFVSTAIVYAVSRRSGMNPGILVLVGIAVSAMGTGIIQALVIKAQLRASSALAWLAGSTYARTWEQLWPLMIWPAVLLPFAWWLCRKLDLLAMSEEVPTGLGVHVVRTRIWAGFIGVALAAAAVATVGTIGFVGLIAPHAARILIGHNHRRLLPATLLIGALLLMAADLAGRLLLSPKEIPSGLVVALLGAPYFIALMRKSAARK
ncbi:iron ABC transporter permease [Paenibacillus beijingensis]|uniref:iron ABC transporter permease n=1 Tax=Paenibacillus beijingensis TaxID=1126833 RepID=UPI001EE772EC|nr:iron ABC transporter permease [Paenibacillus beijingensis]